MQARWCSMGTCLALLHVRALLSTGPWYDTSQPVQIVYDMIVARQT